MSTQHPTQSSSGESVQVTSGCDGKPVGPRRAQSRNAPRRLPTLLFVRYSVSLIARLALFACGVALLLVDPDGLDPARHFGLHAGFSFVNVAFALLVLDGLSKLFPSAKIAMGSLKQYRVFQAPTARTFAGGKEALLDALERVRSERDAIVRDTGDCVRETVEGVRETAELIVREVDVLRLLPRDEHDLTADEELREDIRRQRAREIVPVIVFWILLNAVVALLLSRFGLLNTPVAMVWMLFYFLFDMVCVVAWCPLQLFLMRNRCCTTCQIFNWDAAMAATPLLFVGGWFSWIVIALALVVLLRWELAFARHPERFDERTNASLKCSNCTDALCYLRKPLDARSKER